MGHCICYHTAEEIETSFATDITSRQSSTPDGIVQQPGLMTSLAWDNYDENTDTLSGSGTVHDTVGLCYQNIPTANQDIMVEETTPRTPETEHYSVNQPEVVNTKRPARVFVSGPQQLEPYRKKPKMSKFHYATAKIRRPAHMSIIEWRDTLWMISFTLDTVPMWTGWNSLITPDSLPKQRVAYTENICSPPTRLDVVAKTPKVSQLGVLFGRIWWSQHLNRK